MIFAEGSVNRPISVLMAVISVLVLGFISLQRLPLALLPDISSSSLNVFASYPSSSPGEVERDITRPLEEVLSTLDNLEKISSTSSNTGASVRLEFRAGTNMDLASLEVRDRLDQVRNRLPDEVERISIRRWQSSDSPVFRFSLGWKGQPEDLYGFIEEVVRPRLERIDGVANLDVSGLEPKQIIIDLDPERLQAFGVDIFNLSQALRQNNVNLSGGYVIEGGKKYTLRSVGEFQTVEEIRNFPIRGGLLTLGDLGEVRFDYPEKNTFSRLNSKDSVNLVIYKASTANVVNVCQAISAELGSLQELPQYDGLFEVQVYSDQSEDILNSINDLATAGLFGGALASVVLFLFLLKFRSTLIISMAIPVSVVFTFAFMYLLRVFTGMEITINIVSLMGLMVAVGMLVDASVVVLENIFRFKQEYGLGAFQAAIRGTREVGTAVLASTATTVCVFLSFIFVEDSFSSRWLRDFGIAVSVALIAALVVSLTLIPMLASRIFTGKEKPKQRALVSITDWYAGLMSFLLRWRFVTLILMAVVGWASYALFTSIDRDLVPRVSQREIRLNVLVERSFSLTDIEKLFARLETYLLERKQEYEISAISSRFSNRTSQRGQYRGDLNIFLTDEGKTSPEALTEKIKETLPVVPGVEYQVGRRRHYGGGGDMGVEVQLKGDDPGLLEVYGDLIKQRLWEIPGVRDVQTTLETGDDEIHLAVDRKKTERYGVSTTMVARTISSALSTRATTRVKSDEGEIDVILQMRGGNQISLQEIQNIRFENRDGELIPLSSVIEHQYRKGPLAIRREDRKATLSVVGNTDKGAGMFSMNQAVGAALADLRLPPGYSWEMGSDWRRFRQSEESNYFAIVMAVILMYIIMAALFENFVQPLTILLTVPFSVIGVAGIFYLTSTTLNQMAYLGILVLFGLVVNNGIILIDHVNNLRGQGLERREAVLKAGSDRLRPILMTACTSLFGLLPLVLPFLMPETFQSVEGRARMYAPVSLAVFGGLTTSTFLTLIILPSFYTYMDDLSRLLRWLFDAGAALLRRATARPARSSS